LADGDVRATLNIHGVTREQLSYLEVGRITSIIGVSAATTRALSSKTFRTQP
jgi:hypothetical protein